MTVGRLNETFGLSFWVFFRPIFGSKNVQIVVLLLFVLLLLSFRLRFRFLLCFAFLIVIFVLFYIATIAALLQECCLHVYSQYLV